MSQIPPVGIRPSQLAGLAQVSKQAIDQMVDQLEAAGVLERVPDPPDGRAKLVRPTHYAMDGYAASWRILREIHEEWRGRLGGDLYGRLEEALYALQVSRQTNT